MNSSGNKLRELIQQIRQCKTAAQERATIQKESSLIRESFSKNENEPRARNIAKLIFIQMMGYDCDFGQMQCLNLITSNNFSQKRIGYLGLTQLFNENTQELMLATNRMRQDLQSQSNYVVSLALTSLAEICTAEMCRELAPEVAKLMSHQGGAIFIRRKAILAATRIIRKVPETLDEFVDKIDSLFEERNHAIQICTLILVDFILSVAPQYQYKFQRHIQPMIRVLKGLLTNYQQDYDVSGVSDPFLQVSILSFFRQMGIAQQDISEEISDILAQVVTNTTSTKNAGNAVLYENVRTIMAIESSSALKSLGINILGKFLNNKDANSRYVSLSSLKKVLNYDIHSVQKNKNIIIECLKENDSSIKKLALDLLYLIINEQNVKSIIKEMLNILLLADNEIISDLTLKICLSVEKYCPNKRWYIDTIIKVLTLVGNYVKDESISSLIHVISATPELQTYSVYKLYFSLRENPNLQGLAKAGLYCIGEFGNNLTEGKGLGPDNVPIVVKEQEVIDLIEQILSDNTPSSSDHSEKEIGVTCLMKLYIKFQSTHRYRIEKLIESQTQSSSIEIQQRACEYLALINSTEWGNLKDAIFEKIPVHKNFNKELLTKSVGDEDIDEVPSINNNATDEIIQQVEQPKKEQVNDLIDLDDLLGGGSTLQPNTNQSQATNLNSQNAIDLLNDLFGGGSAQQENKEVQQNINKTASQQQQQQIQKGNNTDLLQDLLFEAPIQQPQEQQQKQVQFKAFEDQNLEIIFSCSKENQDTIQVQASFNNKSNSEISELVFSAAVLKYLKLSMNPISSSRIAANSKGQVTTSMKIQNSMQGKKGIVMKLKLAYKQNGQQFNQEKTVSEFPEYQ